MLSISRDSFWIACWSACIILYGSLLAGPCCFFEYIKYCTACRTASGCSLSSASLNHNKPCDVLPLWGLQTKNLRQFLLDQPKPGLWQALNGSSLLVEGDMNVAWNIHGPTNFGRAWISWGIIPLFEPIPQARHPCYGFLQEHGGKK